MKEYLAKSNDNGIVLEEINPHKPTLLVYFKDKSLPTRNPEYYTFTPLILTSIDPQIKVGQVIREDQLEPDLWKYKRGSGEWVDLVKGTAVNIYQPVRQVAKLKQPVHETAKSVHDLETCTEKDCRIWCTKKYGEPCKVCLNEFEKEEKGTELLLSLNSKQHIESVIDSLETMKRKNEMNQCQADTLIDRLKKALQP